MFARSITTLAAAAILATATFSTASASDEGFEVAPVRKHRSLSGSEIAAGIAIGVVASLIGAEIKSSGHQGNSFKRRRNAQECEDVPVMKGKRVVSFKRICN